MLTAAADQPFSTTLVEAVTESGVKVGLGYHAAKKSHMLDCKEKGAVVLTLLANNNPLWDERSLNPLVEGIAMDMPATIIADGVHVPLNLLKAVIRAKSDVAIVSNSGPPTGLEDYK